MAPPTLLEPTNAWSAGACSGNPGPGGYGAIMVVDGNEYEIDGGNTLTTNNKMELLAAISVVEAAPKDRLLILTVDSEYVKKGATEWLQGWKSRNWRTAGGKEVMNLDLWKRMDTALAARGPVEFLWVRGHTGDIMNERVDQIAVAAKERFHQALLRGEKLVDEHAPTTPVVETPPQVISIPSPTPTSTVTEKRTMTILFADATAAPSATSHPTFYVGTSPETITKYPNAQWELWLANHNRPGTTETGLNATAKYEADLGGRLAAKDHATSAALNRIAKAGLTHGTVTILGDPDISCPKHIIGIAIQKALRNIGHEVKLPQLEVTKNKEIADIFIGGR